MNFDRCPLLVIWEVTRACDLSCPNCRSELHSECDSRELSTEEGYRLLDEVRSFGNPLMILTGGDPLKRSDIYDLISQSVASGLRTNITPSATPLLTPDAVDRFQECGLSRMAIGIDGPDAASHDEFRQSAGMFDRAMTALRRAVRIGLETQVQTVITRRNVSLLPKVAERVYEVNAAMWSLFFPIGPGEDDLASEEYEKIFETLYTLSKIAPFDIKTTEGTHYRRYVAQHQREEDGRRPHWRTSSVGDGKGFVFISHTGDIYPSGFLPIVAGNVRTDSLTGVYRNSELFRTLRDPNSRQGKCARCEYKRLCGGSRARAYALTGNYLAEDPRCSYEPMRR